MSYYGRCQDALLGARVIWKAMYIIIYREDMTSVLVSALLKLTDFTISLHLTSNKELSSSLPKEQNLKH